MGTTQAAVERGSEARARPSWAASNAEVRSATEPNRTATKETAKGAEHKPSNANATTKRPAGRLGPNKPEERAEANRN